MPKVYVGIDFHKNNSVLYTTNQEGRLVDDFPRVKTIQTKSLPSYFSNCEPCEIAIEATGGVNPYAEKLIEQGHFVHIINPNKFRGIGISGKKTDERDSKALNTFLRLNPDSDCEVHLRSRPSRELKQLLVSRELLVTKRVDMTNHIRGGLRENGITLPVGAKKFWDKALEAIGKIKNPFLQETYKKLYELASETKDQQNLVTQKIEMLSQENEKVKNLRTMPGIGPLTAVAMLVVVDDIGRFPDADKFASYLGLVPRVSSSADTRMMGSITKSGNEILRRYLIHGARSWLKKRNSCDDPVRKWALEVEGRRGTNKAVVALARKMSRIAYAMLRDDRSYKEFAFEANVEMKEAV